MSVTQSEPGLGNIQRPTESFRTELVKTKPGENPLFGAVLVKDEDENYYRLNDGIEDIADQVIVVDTWTNQGTAVNNADIDGIREVLAMPWEIVVRLTTANGAKIGSEVMLSATVPGTVDGVTGTPPKGALVGKIAKKASEWMFDVTKEHTNPVNGDNIIINKYGLSR